MTLLFPIMWPAILTQSWTALVINPILESPIMKIAKNLLASRVNLEHNLFTWEVTAFLLILKVTCPTQGGQSLGFIIANLQLNKVPGLPQRSFYTVAFHCPTFVFQAGQSTPYSLFLERVQLTNSKSRWQKFINMKKHFKYILWISSDLGIRCAMKAGQSMTGNQISGTISI